MPGPLVLALVDFVFPWQKPLFQYPASGTIGFPKGVILADFADVIDSLYSNSPATEGISLK